MCVNASVGCCLIIARLPQLWKTFTQYGLLTRTEVTPNSNVFHGEWGMSIFTLKWFPQTWRIKITFTSNVSDVNGFIRKKVVFYLQTYSRPCREVMTLFFFSFLYTWRKWTHYIEYLLGTRHWPWHLADDVSSDTLCCVVFLLPSVSNEETEAKLNARYSRPCSEVCWFRVGSLELGFLNPSTCYATY